MVIISMSGEEGYYPDLQKTAEERLQTLSPNNRHLRITEPALINHNFSTEEWNTITSDVSNWKRDISVRDLRLTEENNNNNSVGGIDAPPIRQPPNGKSNMAKTANKQTAKPQITDYNTWDKYDADTEIVKMDLEVQQDIGKEKEVKRLKEVENERLQLIVKEAEKLSETEKKALAEKEKDRGNEYYGAKEYIEAEKYYSASIAIWPTAKAFNNRAACYLKQCKYAAALSDANSTLALEPDNVKALFRRGVALQHQNKFREALADMAAILKQEPKHLVTQHIAKELREQILTLPRPVRMMTDEGLGKPKRVVEMDSRELRHNSSYNYGSCYEVNEWGLPKIVCQCNGAPRFLQLNNRPSRSLPNRNDFLSNYPPSNSRIVEISNEPAESQQLILNNSTKLEIIEVEKLENEPVEEFFMPKKCNIVDRRTQKHNSELNLKTVDVNGDCRVPNLMIGDSSMDDEFENMCPLLEDVEPKA
ncbi:sperm-associated antigen 1-like isoform X2 [Macrosteles quadrilineatus]|uniref:sperm-associated antigen 1-like isoform X2 n=1 Tax=Macrosteles quadrilineatus TaxID=74068 RepID=UPI0023E2532D|nr:sperm-associated antigen 1-like isoform X2 [Macrosteles quadrilineatus]XP_054280623.1 sperm-associated antigen 1-like isoform X2 [Macrosteles quadrilineatus]